MIRTSAFVLAIITYVATPFSGSARAMVIEQFDKLAIPDQGDYIALLLQGAQDILREAGRHDDLAKLNKLFLEVRSGDKTSIGMIEFEENLARARLLDAQRYARDHNVVRLEVEHAILLTLRKNDIELPPSFMHVADNFRPKLPMKRN
jgi:hypothetical protein